MRALQALLERERRREFAEQRRHDAEAQGFMDTDPRGHIEMMKSMQERQALVRELPEALLAHEAALLQEIEPASSAQADAKAKELDMGVLMARHLLMERWAQIAVLPLGAWLVASPLAFGYRAGALVWSDIISGLLVISFGALSVGRRPWAPWANAVVGLWLMFAPLAFWSPDAVAYANDTLVGMLVIAFAVIIPMRTEMPGPDIPPGWTYSPSTWPQRGPIIALAFLSFFMSRYMAAFQLGHIPTAWDPIFGKGTELVLTSDVSRAFPISDAGLGAYTYLIEILSGLMGDSRRWRTMPWMVAMFGFAVIPLGITSVILIMLQPVAVGAWCTLCLTSALLMLIMVTLSLDEIVAMVQFLVIGRRAGLSAWRLFWIGGSLPRPVEEIGVERRRRNPWAEMFWGANVPWPLLAGAALGAWLFASRAVFGTTGAAADAESILGALIVTVVFIAFAEVGRVTRFLNILLALAIPVALWVLPGASLAARVNALVAGALLIVLSIPRGPIRNRYGGWDPFIV
ncbi:MAG: vitamin K epoxide reductase family protein [bacterium]